MIDFFKKTFNSEKEEDLEPKDLEIRKLKKEISLADMKKYMLVIAIFFEIAILSFVLSKYMKGNKIEHFDNEIAVINIDKTITEPYINTLMEDVTKKLDDEKTKEFLMILNSPGGSPMASEEFSEFIKEINKEKKVTVYVEGMAASGGYYIASAIKPLYSNKNAIVGSIGVIMPHYSLEDLAKKVGIKEDYVAAGKYKKPVSYFKDLDKENKKYLEEYLIKPSYENFLDSVSKNRGVDKEKIRKVADGKIYIANSPKIKGILVDQITHLSLLKRKIKERVMKSENAEKDEVGFVPVDADRKTNLPFSANFKVDLDTILSKTTLQ